MRIACLGGGPAGLYFAISMKLRDPAHEIDLFERNRRRRHVRLGRRLLRPDGRESDGQRSGLAAPSIRDEFAHWDDIDVHIHGADDPLVRPRLHRHRPQAAARASCRSGRASSACSLHFEHEASADLDDWAGYDLVIAADGANSRIRDRYEEHFGVDIQVRRNKFFWFGTHKVFDAFTFAFEQTEAGWVWAHAYRFDDDLSTFIVEMDPETWAGLGLDRMDQAEAIALVRADLRQISRRPRADVQRRPPARARRRGSTSAGSSATAGRYGNLILLGDAAHTAHFSIGSGTKLALEDAIKLAEVLNRPGPRRATRRSPNIRPSATSRC